MLKKSFVLVFAVVYGAAGLAAEHAQEAASHAGEAASSAGDSKAVGEHAQEALRHAGEAKGAATDAATARHLNAGEADLNAALKNAKQYNSGTAAQEAKDAKSHFDAAGHK